VYSERWCCGRIVKNRQLLIILLLRLGLVGFNKVSKVSKISSVRLRLVLGFRVRSGCSTG